MSSDLKDVGKFFQTWLSRFKPEDWESVYSITLDKLFDKYVLDEANPPGQWRAPVKAGLIQDLQAVDATLWDPKKIVWQGVVPDGWRELPRLEDIGQFFTMNDTKYPDHVFMFCSASAGRHVPGSFFLQAATLQQMRKVVTQENLTHIHVPDTKLIALNSKKTIKSLNETEQNWSFVLAINVKDITTTWMTDHSENAKNTKNSNKPLQISMEAQREIAQLCCYGLPVSNTFWTLASANKVSSNRIVVLTRPLSCFVLDDSNDAVSEEATQYHRTKELVKGKYLQRKKLAKTCLEHLSLRVDFGRGLCGNQKHDKNLPDSDVSFRSFFRTVLQEL